MPSNSDKSHNPSHRQDSPQRNAPLRAEEHQDDQLNHQEDQDEQSRFHADIDDHDESESRFTFSTLTTDAHPDIQRINNNLVYIAAMLSDINEHLGLIPPSATHERNIIADYPICCVEDCREYTFSVLVEPDEEPTPVCHDHFNEVMQAHLTAGKAGHVYTQEQPSEDW